MPPGSHILVRAYQKISASARARCTSSTVSILIEGTGVHLAGVDDPEQSAEGAASLGRSGRSAGPAGQALRLQDEHALALQPQPAAVGEVGERLVDRLPGGA